MNVADKSQKTETAFKLFDRNKDGYITREEFTKVATQGAKTFLIKVITINHSFLSIIIYNKIFQEILKEILIDLKLWLISCTLMH